MRVHIHRHIDIHIYMHIHIHIFTYIKHDIAYICTHRYTLANISYTHALTTHTHTHTHTDTETTNAAHTDHMNVLVTCPPRTRPIKRK